MYDLNGCIVKLNLFEIDAYRYRHGSNSVCFICDSELPCNRSQYCNDECVHTCDLSHIKYPTRFTRLFEFENGCLFELDEVVYN